MSKIDHIFGNAYWKDKFTDSSTSFILGGLSDHTVVILNSYDIPIKRRAPFKIFNHLFDHLNFLEHLTSSWSTTTKFKGVVGIWYKFKNVKNNLKALHVSNVNKVADKVNYWSYVLFDAQSSSLSGSLISIPTEKIAYGEFKIWLHVENYILAKKSRISWLTNSDECTKFFHVVTKENRATRRISRLFDGYGCLITSEYGIRN